MQSTHLKTFTRLAALCLVAAIFPIVTQAQTITATISSGDTPLLRAETYYRHQIMLRTRQMARLSQSLARLLESLNLPDDVMLTVDIDPVNLA